MGRFRSDETHKNWNGNFCRNYSILKSFEVFKSELIFFYQFKIIFLTFHHFYCPLLESCCESLKRIENETRTIIFLNFFFFYVSQVRGSLNDSQKNNYLTALKINSQPIDSLLSSAATTGEDCDNSDENI